ncbi:MAG: hypothetical protein ACKOWD_01085 [Rhodoferax sp.]
MTLTSFARCALAIMVCSASDWSLAQGQTVYRCGAIYSDMPCAQSVTISSSDARSGSQKAQTDEATARTAKLADQMEKNRKADEAAAQRVAQMQAQAQAIKAKIKASAPDKDHKPAHKQKEPTAFKAITNLPLKHPKKAAAQPPKSEPSGSPKQELQPKP